MRLPVTWLKDTISFSFTPEKLAEFFTMSGTAVEGIDNKSGEPVLRLEITTNRPDCLSLIGLTRELSALTGIKAKYPSILNAGLKKADRIGRLSVAIKDKKACPFYTVRLIENVSVASSPMDAQKRLDWVDARPISNVVDATNFVLFEMGQPLHAFDADKISGGIVVRRARKGEKFLTISGVELTLEEKTLVIADEMKVIAIAGVIGGKNSEVSTATKNILLESAYFDPVVVRQAARQYKIATDSSYRFERGVNPGNVGLASARARDLISLWAKGEDRGGVAVGALPKNPFKPIAVRVARVKLILGIEVKPSRILTILKALGFSAKNSGKEKILVQPSPARRDVTQEADIIEEILRIEGFGKIPSLLPVTRHDNSFRDNSKYRKIYKLKNYLASAGFQEIVNYSFLSAKALADSGVSESDAQKVANPLSAEQEYLRPSLLPGILSSIAFNVNRRQSSLKFFEVGNGCIQSKEKTLLAIALYGRFEENWRRKSECTFFELKGVVENVAELLEVSSQEWYHRIRIISSDVLKKWDIPHDVHYAELDLDEMLEASSEKNVKIRPVAKFPLVKRDVAIVIDEKIEVGELEKAIRSAGAPYLEEVRLFDQYSGKNIPKGKRSLAFSLAYQNPSSTFTDEEIQRLQERVGAELKSRFQAEFR